MLFTFRKPLIFALAGVLMAVMAVVIDRIPDPLYQYTERRDTADADSYAKAHRAALGVPRALLSITLGMIEMIEDTPLMADIPAIKLKPNY